MKKNEDRKLAERIFVSERSRITNKELAQRLGVHPATVARWRKLDDWDAKLAEAEVMTEEQEAEQDDFYQVDLRHIRLLNERIDAYLRKKELLPSEIRELAEAKFHIMNCMEIIHDQVRYPLSDQFEQQGSDIA
jgi:hypothetical protein